MRNIVIYITYFKTVMRSTKLVKKGEVPRFFKCGVRSVSPSDIIRGSRPGHQESSLSRECERVCACAGLLRVFRCQRSFQDPNVDSRHAVITQSEYRRINKHPRSPGHNSCFVCSSGGALAGERPRALLTALCTVSPSHSGPGSALSHWTAVN